jgi:hypothetical protein
MHIGRPRAQQIYGRNLAALHGEEFQDMGGFPARDERTERQQRSRQCHDNIDNEGMKA